MRGQIYTALKELHRYRASVSVDLDGTNEYFGSHNFFDPNQANYEYTQPVSYSVWIKPDVVTGTQTIMSRNDFTVFFGATGFIIQRIGTNIFFTCRYGAANYRDVTTTGGPIGTAGRWYNEIGRAHV